MARTLTEYFLWIVLTVLTNLVGVPVVIAQYRRGYSAAIALLAAGNDS
jgi:hypothetical protein